MDESSMRELMERVQSLECDSRAVRAQLRRWKLCGLASVLATFVVLILGAQGPSQRDNIRVRKIELVNGRGELGILMECTEDGPAIGLADGKGKPRLALMVHKSDQASFEVLDESGKPRMRLGEFPDRSTRLVILGRTPHGAGGKTLVDLGLDGEDTGFLSFHDKGDPNRVLVSALAGPDGASRISLSERRGTREVRLDCKPTGAAAANVVELDTGRRVGLGVPRAGLAGPGVDVFGRDGRLVGALMVLPNGDAALQLRDRDQRVSFQIPRAEAK